MLTLVTVWSLCGSLGYNGYMRNLHMLFTEEKEYSKVRHWYIGYSLITLGYNGCMGNPHMSFIEEKQYSKYTMVTFVTVLHYYKCDNILLY